MQPRLPDGDGAQAHLVREKVPREEGNEQRQSIAREVRYGALSEETVWREEEVAQVKLAGVGSAMTMLT